MSSGSSTSSNQICIQRSGGSSGATEALDDARTCRREMKLRIFSRKNKCCVMEAGVASSSMRRLERAAVRCTDVRRRSFGERGDNPSSASPANCDMAAVSAGCSSSGLAFSTCDTAGEGTDWRLIGGCTFVMGSGAGGVGDG